MIIVNENIDLQGLQGDWGGEEEATPTHQSARTHSVSTLHFIPFALHFCAFELYALT